MRIAMFHATLPEQGRKLGGVEVCVHRLANELAKHSEDSVTVFSLSAKPPDAAYSHHRLFDGRAWLRRQAFRLSLLPAALNRIPWSTFDVLHLHGDDWFFVKRTCPTVRTLHGSALREAQTAESLKRKVSQFLVYPLEHLATRLATVPLAIGPDTGRLYGIRHLADNGVDLGLFSPGPKTEKPQILYIGTWSGRKRGRFLFEVFTRHILPKMPSARLLMASDYAPIHPQVQWIGFPSDRELAALYRASWVFAYPSVYEGFGVPYLEAMASGTAIVSSPNPGAEYLLENGKYGVIAEDADFGQCVVDLLKNAEARIALENSGRERATEFSWAAIAAWHRAIYLEASAYAKPIVHCR